MIEYCEYIDECSDYGNRPAWRGLAAVGLRRDLPHGGTAARPATATSVCTQQVALSLSYFVSLTTVKVQIVEFNTCFLVFLCIC